MKRSKRSSSLDEIELDGEDRPLTCPNCGAKREGPYCHECGQRYMKARLTAWELWWIFADRFLDWEEGVWRTFLKMATAPGVVIRHYLSGRRKTYLNPFSYVLFCAALYALGQFVMRRIAGMSALPGIEDVQEFGMALNNVEDQFTLIAYGTVLIVALMAVAMRIMFDGRLLNAMEAIVTALYASGNVFVLSFLVSLFEMILTGDPLPTKGLLITFGVLFPFCVGHAGRGLFEDWGMALYTAMTPIVAATISTLLYFIVMGTYFVGGVVMGDVATGNVTSLAWALGVLAMVLGPALATFLVELYG